MSLSNGQNNYMDYWHFSNHDKNVMIEKLTAALPALRGAVGATQAEIASAVGISRQTYGSIENRQRKMSWITYMSLIFSLTMHQARMN